MSFKFLRHGRDLPQISKHVCFFFGGVIIEIITNTGECIESKIGERVVLGGKFMSWIFTHSRSPNKNRAVLGGVFYFLNFFTA